MEKRINDAKKYLVKTYVFNFKKCKILLYM